MLDEVSANGDEKWRIFENQYFSFMYPPQWTVEDITESYKSLSDTKFSLHAYEGNIEISNQGLTIDVYSKLQFTNSLLENNSNKELLEKAIQSNNLIDFIRHSRYSCKESLIVCRLSQHRGFVDINGKRGYLFLAVDNNPQGVHVIKVIFLSNHNVIELTINDSTEVPIDTSLLNGQEDILKAIGDRSYGKIIRSLKIK